MKKNVFLLLIVISFISSTAQTITDIPSMEQKAHEGLYSKSMMSNAINNYDIKYHRCEWEVNPAVLYIKGAITTYFKPTVAGFNQLQFDLTDSLTVDSVKYHSTLLTYLQLPGDILQIAFSSVIPVNTLDSVTVYYKGIPPSSGFGSFHQGTHDTTLHTPVIWTLSEPLGAKDWWPCKQELLDKIDSVDIIVTTPQANRVGSNGLLISETQSGLNKIYHWKTRYQIAAYLVAIGVSNYSVYSNYVPLPGGDSLQVLNYVYPEDSIMAQSMTPDIINTIKFYDSLTIVYPFANEKYGHLEFGWGGGMEHQTMSFVGGFSHYLMAHECAHQWFGDRVTCGSWQDIWLNEGFATYFETLTEERYFHSTFVWQLQQRILNITSIPNGSVLCTDTMNVSRIFDGRLSYWKGCYLLHMLRWKLGDSLFFLALKNYLTDPLLAGGYAKTPDLKAHLENTSGQNLTNFFNEWYYNQGYPSYQLFWNQVGNAVNLTVNQTTSDPSLSFYEMPIPVEFKGIGHDTIIVFNHTFSGQTFNATLTFTVDSVKFDPDIHILSANNTVTGIPDVNALINRITIYPNPVKFDITLSIQLKKTDELTFEMFDVAGKLVYSKQEIIPAGSSVKTIPAEHFANGDYIINIKGSEINYSGKIAKQ